MKLTNSKIKYFLMGVFLVSAVVCYQIITGREDDNHKKNNRSDFGLSYIEIDSLIDYDFSFAEKLINSYYLSSEKELDDRAKAHLYYYKILIDIRKNNKDSIPAYLEKAVLFSSVSQDEYVKAKVDYIKGLYCLYIDNFPSSLDSFLKAKSFFEKERDNTYLAQVYNGLGGLYYGLRELKKSESYYSTALELFDEEDDDRGRAVIEANLGRVKLYLGGYNEAKHLLYSSLETFKTLKDTVSTIRVLFSISEVEKEESNYSLALEYLDEAYKLACSINDYSLQSLSFLYYGYVYEKRGNLEMAVELYKEAYENTRDRESYFPIEILDALQRLSALLLHKEGGVEEAFMYMKRYYEMKDSISGPNVWQNIEAISYNTMLEKQEYEFLLERQKQKSLNKTYIIIIISVFSSVITIWILYRNKNKSLKISRLENMRLSEKVSADKEVQELRVQQHKFEIKAKNELQKLQESQYKLSIEVKNKELNLMSVQLLSKSKLLSEIEEIVSNEGNNSKYTFIKLQKAIRHHRSLKKDWEQFREIFQKIHPNFFNLLRKRSSELTKTEIRICTFIKIGMSNHQIAEVLNISQASLITNRYRIRKKLNLLRNTDLDNYINSIDSTL